MNKNTIPTIKVLPWNGAKAAISLTFDDGDKSHIETAIPSMNERGIKGTFFLAVKTLINEEAWIQAVKDGHEIGNHSTNHIHPVDISTLNAEEEVLSSQTNLSEKFNTQIYSFAYPYSFITPEMEDKLRDTHLSARGGQSEFVHMKPSDTPDWLNIPSVITFTDCPPEIYMGWIEESLNQNAWTVFMIHGIEGTDVGYQPIDKKVFIEILDRLENPDIWVDTYGTISAYWRAQKMVESAKQRSISNGTEYSWQVHSVFPEGINLKVELEDGIGKFELIQNGERLKEDSNGIYSISFNAGSLEIRCVE